MKKNLIHTKENHTIAIGEEGITHSFPSEHHFSLGRLLCCSFLLIVAASSSLGHPVSERELGQARAGYGKYAGYYTVSDSPSKTWKEVRFHYWSIDERGQRIKLSAFMTWPKAQAFGVFRRLFERLPVQLPYLSETKCEDVVLYCPYTHVSSTQCATESNYETEFASNLEKLTTIMPNWIIIPDGEGFGLTASTHTQLYLNHEVWAEQEVDCLKAAWEIRNLINKESPDKILLDDDWKLVLVGSSQGAGTALATMRYMENVSSNMSTVKLDEQFRLAFANVCCGPYDPALTLMTYLQNGTICYPAIIPLTIQSMLNSFPKEMEGVTETDFYTANYLAIKTESGLSLAEAVDKALCVDDRANKTGKNTTDMAELNALMQTYLEKDEYGHVRLDEILNDGVLKLAYDPKHASDIAKRLMNCLQRTSVFDGVWEVDEGPWTPKHFIWYYYNRQDDVVPYENAQLLAQRCNQELAKGGDVTKLINYASLKASRSNEHIAGCGGWMFSFWTKPEWNNWISLLRRF